MITEYVIKVKIRIYSSEQTETAMLEQIRKLAREKSICVLATIAGAKPYCSLMAYAADDACKEIYMVTHRKTQKYQNLLKNPEVSLLIDTREETPRTRAQALTVEGRFQKIKDEAKKRAVRQKLLKTHPHLKAFIDHQDAELICIKINAFLLLNGLTDAHYEKL